MDCFYTECGKITASDVSVRRQRFFVFTATLPERHLLYTFHADPGFSFGEGWYLAAAAQFAGLSIQIRPGAAQELQAR